MRRRSSTGRDPAKARSRKAATLKRRNRPKVTRSRPSSVGGKDKKIALLTHERDEALEQQAATAEVLKALSRSTFDLQSVLDSLLENAVRLCGAERGFIYRQDGDVYRIAASYGHSDEFLEKITKQNPIYQDRSSATGRAVLDRRVVHIHDILADPEYRWGADHRSEKEMHRTVLAAPMLKGDTIIGVIVIRRIKVQPFTDKHIALLSNFAAQAVIAIENTRLLNELRESLQQQTATADVLKVISRSTFDLQIVLNTLAESAMHLCRADKVVIFLREGDTYRLTANYGYSREYEDFMRRHPITPGRGTIAGRTALECQPVHVSDIRADPDYTMVEAQRLGGFRTMLGVPLMRDGMPIGVMTLLRNTVQPFSEAEIDLATTFADQAVIAIANVRLFEAEQQRTRELSESLQQQTATAEVLKVISRSTFDLPAVLNTLVESAARLCAADNGVIFQRDGDLYRLAANYGFSREVERFVAEHPLRPDRGSVTGRAALEGKAIHVPDVLTDPEYRATDHQELGRYRTMLGVPLVREGTTIGVFALSRPEVHPFSEKQIELVSTFADQAAIAIENVRLFEAERQRTRELSESLEQQTATSEVLNVISRSAFDLQPVFDAIAENGVRLCEAERAFIFRFDGESLRAVAYYNVGLEIREFVDRNPIVPGRHSISARAALEQRTIHVPDVQADPDYAYAMRDVDPIRTILAVPMLKGNDLVGTITIYRLEVKPFTDKQVALMETFAAQAVIAIENTRLLNELRESLQQQTATADVLKIISRSTFDLQAVLDTLVQSAARLCEADTVLIGRPKNETFQFEASYGYPREYAELVAQPVGIDRGSCAGRALLERKIVHVVDALADPEYTFPATLAGVAGSRTLLGVPLLREGSPIGAMTLGRKLVRPFTDKQIELAETFANQAVIAIENVRLLHELRDSLQQQTATADVLKVISRSAFDLQAVLDTLVQSAARLCEADHSFLFRHEGENYIWGAYHGYSGEYLEYMKSQELKPGRGTAIGRAALDGQIVHIPDVLEDAEYTWWESQKVGKYRAVLAVPLIREGLPIGVLGLTRLEPRSFTDKQIELLTTFADQAVIAIENVRLFESVEARTRELAKSLEDLRTAQDRLVQTEKLASLGQLTAGIAHEIKNPLNFVNNFSAVSVELIDELREALGGVHLDGKLRAEITEIANTLQGNLDKVVQHGKRADAIVKNMLLHSRQGSGEHRPVDINALVEESLNLAYHGARAEKQGFTITLERAFDPAAGEADLFPQEITRALLNLISNGFYAATKRKTEGNGGDYEPTLAAATKNLGDRVEIRIRDNGTGIPPEVKENLFSPFYTTKPAGEGTGLGLSISHDIIVKQHGGSIEVDTQPGEFTEFRIVLPRAGASLIKSGERA
jgi:GAF domain-containing protein